MGSSVSKTKSAFCISNLNKSGGLIMVSTTLTVKNKSGLHARPASKLVKLCVAFESELCIHFGEATIDPKSIVDLLSNGVKQGTTIELTAEGPDEQKAIDEIVALIESFDE